MLSNVGKIVGIEEKSKKKSLEVGNPIWNTFHYCNFFKNSTDFEIFKRF
jgi:hypothetical protein